MSRALEGIFDELRNGGGYRVHVQRGPSGDRATNEIAVDFDEVAWPDMREDSDDSDGSGSDAGEATVSYRHERYSAMGSALRGYLKGRSEELTVAV